jgi:cellulose synthase/poly-beta-1,6-N-acetylglucosamine synthase-like glycosyltransferase
VVVPFRNEAPRLAACIASILAQSYPTERWELILVDDHSTDESLSVIQEFFPHPGIRLLQAEGEGKKAALATGIRAAKGEIILQTDADVRVAKDWIWIMAASFSPETALVSGPVYLEPGTSLFGQVQSLESMGLVSIGAGSIGMGKPNMCNGANLAFRKSAFEEVGGFSGIDGVASGDDELLLQKIHALGKYEIRFAKSFSALVSTDVQPDWESFRAQRLRWVSKVRAYPDKRVNRIQLISYLGFLSFPVSLLWGIWQVEAWYLFFGLFTAKVLVDSVLMYRSAKFFHKLPQLRTLFWLEIVYIPYVLWIGLAGNLVQTYSWKGRRVA